MSNLVDHAKRELELLGEDEWLSDGIITMVETFSAMGHSGSSAAHTIAVLAKLLRFENLTELTDDPKEWMHISGDIWQSTRNSEAFSNDEGNSYYLLSEGGNDSNRKPVHKSNHKES